MFLVTGASGNVGGELVRALASAGETVRALTRGSRPSTLPTGVEAVTGDLNQPDSLLAALAGVRGVFLLPGYQDMPGLLAAIHDGGAERVVLLSGGSAASGDMSNAISAYMIRSESAVRDSGLPWTILRPSAFMSNALRWLPQLTSADVVRAPFGSVATAVVDPHDVAAVAVEALRAGGHEKHIYQPTGPESLLPADQIRILARVLRRDLRFEAQPDDEARAEMLKNTPAEYVDAFFDFYAAGTLDESRVRTTVQDVTGRAPRTFAQWATAHADAFR
jgi:uncharacterized protein YbjT (DUF2867 family)